MADPWCGFLHHWDALTGRLATGGWWAKTLPQNYDDITGPSVELILKPNGDRHLLVVGDSPAVEFGLSDLRELRDGLSRYIEIWEAEPPPCDRTRVDRKTLEEVLP